LFKIFKIGCYDYHSQKGEVYKDVAPIFYVETILRSVENPKGLDSWQIYVNDHNQRTYTFALKSDCIHQTNLLSTLAANGIIISPCWYDAVCNHLLYGHQQCRQTQSIVYQNKVLGWYKFEDKTYYFYDETDFDGKHAICARPKMQFRKGDREKYMDLIRNVVLPSTELSLAISIGYTAVVAARLKEPADLRCNLGERLRRVHCG
jgi:hypothetical protein